MTADYLLIDVGNGRTKFALATSERLLEQCDFPTSELTGKTLRGTLENWKWARTVCCSVVPRATETLRTFIGDSLLVLKHDTALGIGIRYPKPETIGPDRLANAIALVHLHGAPGIVIDFGTAVTFDIVDHDSCYIGGVIAPGLRLMTDYLHERTALLPRVELREPASVIGKSTEEAILAGAAIGYRSMVSGLLEACGTALRAVGSKGILPVAETRMQAGCPQNTLAGSLCHVIATGGDAAWIASGLPEIQVVDEDLTLQGLRLVGNLHAPK